MKKHFTYLVLLTIAVTGSLSAQPTDTAKVSLLDSLKREYSYEICRQFINRPLSNTTEIYACVTNCELFPITSIYSEYFTRVDDPSFILPNSTHLSYEYGCPARTAVADGACNIQLHVARKGLKTGLRALYSALMSDAEYRDIAKTISRGKYSNRAKLDSLLLRRESIIRWFSSNRQAQGSGSIYDLMSTLPIPPSATQGPLLAETYDYNPPPHRNDMFHVPPPETLIGFSNSGGGYNSKSTRNVAKPRPSYYRSKIPPFNNYIMSMKKANKNALRIILIDHILRGKALDVNWISWHVVQHLTNDKLRDLETQIEALEK